MKDLAYNPEEQPEFIKKLVQAAQDGPEDGVILLAEGNHINGWKVACISMIGVRPKGKGNGTAVMKRICEVADANGIILKLDVQPNTKEDEIRRIRFFSRFKFEIDEPVVHMTRNPPSWRWEDESLAQELENDADLFPDYKGFFSRLKKAIRIIFDKE